MSASNEQVLALIGQQAADWFIANRAGLSASERDTFTEWLKASPVHVEEYLALCVIGRDLREACADSAQSIDSLVAGARAEQNRPVPPAWQRTIAANATTWKAVAFALVGVLLLGGLMTWWSIKPNSHVPSPAATSAFRIATRHGEQLTRRLPDGSVLHLNTDSAANIEYSNSERLVSLSSGEAFFEVTREATRGFRVIAGSAQIIAIGTQFNVRLAEHTTVVTVLAGKVVAGPSRLEGKRAPSNLDSALLVPVAAGQQIRVAEDQWPAKPAPVSAERSTSWLHRQIIFEHEPLQQVVAEFNRYAPKPIELVTPALQDLEISGVFATDDTDSFVAFLRSLDRVRVEVTASRIRVSQQ